ncbi:ATP-binding protein [Actinomadura xylanilytica]|uniref:ATP-binding protein n=1 Tax=Actinomadura xylanilytica TaxID=887459 RepID=UPI00255AC897|nr:ATP-binding protein [Actinomadura xylanilytica]MDL4775747.1 ATP-binding protein [Actinomadura xylanilytica]
MKGLTTSAELLPHCIPAAHVISGCNCGGGRRCREVIEEMSKRKWGCSSPADWLRLSEPMAWRRTYAGRLDQIPVARQFAVALFAGTGYEDEVAFIVTELTSNAVRHTRSGEHGGWFGLELTLADLAYLAVTDQGGRGFPTVVVEQPGGERCEHGRGLLTVSELAVAVGTHGNRDVGHTVWADLDLKARPEARPDLAIVLGM